MMTSCASSTVIPPKISDLNINPELLEECTDPPKLKVGTKGEVILYIHDIKSAYILCKEKHSALSSSVKEIFNSEN